MEKKKYLTLNIALTVFKNENDVLTASLEGELAGMDNLVDDVFGD